MTGIPGFRSVWTRHSSSPTPRMTIAGEAPPFCNACTHHAATGVLPVPPTVRFPIESEGIAELAPTTRSK